MPNNLDKQHHKPGSALISKLYEEGRHFIIWFTIYWSIYHDLDNKNKPIEYYLHPYYAEESIDLDSLNNTETQLIETYNNLSSIQPHIHLAITELEYAWPDATGKSAHNHVQNAQSIDSIAINKVKNLQLATSFARNGIVNALTRKIHTIKNLGSDARKDNNTFDGLTAEQVTRVIQTVKKYAANIGPSTSIWEELDRPGNYTNISIEILDTVLLLRNSTKYPLTEKDESQFLKKKSITQLNQTGLFYKENPSNSSKLLFNPQKALNYLNNWKTGLFEPHMESIAQLLNTANNNCAKHIEACYTQLAQQAKSSNIPKATAPTVYPTSQSHPSPSTTNPNIRSNSTEDHTFVDLISTLIGKLATTKSSKKSKKSNSSESSSKPNRIKIAKKTLEHKNNPLATSFTTKNAKDGSAYVHRKTVSDGQDVVTTQPKEPQSSIITTSAKVDIQASVVSYYADNVSTKSPSTDTTTSSDTSTNLDGTVLYN